MTAADEGITGTNMKKRDGFNQMIADALDGKIDLIITKSVSRFARNTVDSLTTVRKLKEKGVEVYFQKENIYTLDSKGELLITIMSSLAQEESRSISENTTWGQRKRFADGKMSLAYSNFLGYKKGSEDGEMEIVEEEAVIVRRIYDEYLFGKTPYDIATRLTEEQIPTPGKKTQWRVSTIISILHNEKYRGDAILQKKYTVDFLSKTTKKMKANCRCTIYLKTTPQSFARRFLRWCRRSSADGKQPEVTHSAYPFSLVESSARIVAGITAERYGTPAANTLHGTGIATTSS